jgi:DNA-binding MarR family transcriptional regulator
MPSSTPLSSEINNQISSIRRFNRFYTRAIGTLQEGLLESPLSLPEARVLYEIASRNQPIASEIAAALRMDLGYLSRILSTFTARKLITRTTSPNDARQTLLSLTKAGQQQFATLNRRSNQQIKQMIQPFTTDQRSRLVAAMNSIESLLGDTPSPEPYILRPHRPGDMGWVISRHGALYASAAGSPTAPASRWAASSSSKTPNSPTPHVSVSSWSSPAHAASALAAPLFRSARTSRARPDTSRSLSGPTASSTQPAISISAKATASSAKNPTTASVKTW